jgi:hypothetical protein
MHSHGLVVEGCDGTISIRTNAIFYIKTVDLEAFFTFSGNFKTVTSPERGSELAPP